MKSVISIRQLFFYSNSYSYSLLNLAALLCLGRKGRWLSCVCVCLSFAVFVAVSLIIIIARFLCCCFAFCVYSCSCFVLLPKAANLKRFMTAFRFVSCLYICPPFPTARPLPPAVLRCPLLLLAAIFQIERFSHSPVASSLFVQWTVTARFAGLAVRLPSKWFFFFFLLSFVFHNFCRHGSFQFMKHAYYLPRPASSLEPPHPPSTPAKKWGRRVGYIRSGKSLSTRLLASGNKAAAIEQPQGRASRIGAAQLMCATLINVCTHTHRHIYICICICSFMASSRR